MAKTIPLERRSLAAQVADALRELIMSNTYRQGQQLRQDDLASASASATSRCAKPSSCSKPKA